MLKIRLEYWKLLELAQKDPEKFEHIRKAKPDLKPAAEFEKSWDNFEAFIQSPEDLPDWMISLVAFEAVRPLKILNPDGSWDSGGVAQAVMRSQVHLPGNELLRIRSVEVKENYCTESLQKDLDSGWRIIAVCPQPSRRPDYILGRFE